MRVHVLSESGQGYGIAQRFKQSGHSVFFEGHITEGESTPPDLIINLTPQRLESNGAKYLGPTQWSAALDEVGDYAKKIISMIGWPTTPIVNGTNLYITTWFNGDSSILSYATILYRRLMAGGCGPDIGCAGAVSLFDSLTDKTHETLIKPLEKILKRVSHQGVFHIHVVVNSQSFYVKGVSTQLYHPLTLAALENTNLAVANVFLKTLDITSRPLRPLDPVGASVFLSAPPFPYHPRQGADSMEIKGINTGSLKHLWLEDVIYDKSYWLTPTGKLGHVTARGVTPQEACRRIYKTVSNISVPDMQYRNDVGRNINTLIESLKTSGWVN